MASAIQRLNPVGFNAGRTKFPVVRGSNAREGLKSLLTKPGKIHTSSPLFGFMVDQVKPYEGGDSDIWAIHRLDIDDKHHLLIPVVNVVSVDGVEIEKEDGTIEGLTFTAHKPIHIYRLPIPPGSNVKDYGNTTIRIAFRQGVLTDNLEVVPTLLRFSRKTQRIVHRLQQMAGFI